MHASLRRDTVTARGVSDAAIRRAAHSTPPVRKREDGPLREVYRDALVTVVVWLVLFGLALLGLSAAATRPRPMVAPLGWLPELVSPRVSGTNSADGGNVSRACSRDSVRLTSFVPMTWSWRIR